MIIGLNNEAPTSSSIIKVQITILLTINILYSKVDCLYIIVSATPLTGGWIMVTNIQILVFLERSLFNSFNRL